MNIQAKVTEKVNHTKEIIQNLNYLKKQQVMVGIPDGGGGREGGISNADLLFIHTNGSPRNGIPARPVIEPAIEYGENKTMIADQLSEAGKAAFDRNRSGIDSALDAAGQLGENASKEWFTNSANGWAANKPATIKRKGSSAPLIDTGSMRGAITHVRRSK